MWTASSQLRLFYPPMGMLLSGKVGVVSPENPKKDVEDSGTSSSPGKKKGSILKTTKLRKNDNNGLMTAEASKDQDIQATGTTSFTSHGYPAVVSFKFDDDESTHTNTPEDEAVGATGTSITLKGSTPIFFAKMSDIDYYKGIVTMQTPEGEGKGVVGLSYTPITMERGPTEHLAQMVPSGVGYGEGENLGWASKYFKMTRKFFSDLPTHYQTLRYDNLKYLLVLCSEIMYCIVVDGDVVSAEMVSMNRLPSHLRTAISERLPTWKRLMVLGMEETDLPPADSDEVTTRVLPSGLRVCETKDAIYFVELTRVFEEPDDDVEIDYSTTTTDNDGPQDSGSWLAIVDQQVSDVHSETAADDFRAESASPVAEHGEQKPVSKPSRRGRRGLMAFFRNLFKMNVKNVKK